MMEPQQNSRCLSCKGGRAAFPSALGLAWIVLLFSVQTAVAAQQSGAVPLTQGIADLASQLAKSIPEGHPMTIAVTDFPQKKQVCGLGQFVAERLSTLLSRQPQCRLIERHRLDQVLQELKFSMSELVDPAKARRLGQMLGVQGLVVGTVTDLGTTFDVDARIIDIQTDVSLPGASVSVVKDETVRSLSADCAGSARPSVGPGGAEPMSPHPLQPIQSARAVVAEGITFEVKSCGVSVRVVTCRVALTNGSREDKNVGIQSSRMIDNTGNEFQPQRWRFGSRESGFFSTQNTLVSGTPINLLLTFQNVSAEATTIALLEITCFLDQPGDRLFVARLRDIPLTR